ncbi:hypothetical protein [Caballeronia sp. DA-9]|uniref:hypothetical protein n=1 Tax=Caballeronia sp. DA-9 TaxID=3436237 RepID=UPI003F677B71
MLIQTFETLATWLAICGLHFSLLTPAALAHAFGSLLGVMVGVVLPLGIAVSAHRRLEEL